MWSNISILAHRSKWGKISGVQNIKKQARKGFRPISASQIFLGSLKAFLGNFLAIFWQFFRKCLGFFWN